MSSTTLAANISMVFIFRQMGRELLYLTGVLESVDKKVDRLLRANYNAGVSALESALKCPPRDKHRFVQLIEARHDFRLAVEKEDGLRKAFAHFYFAFCQYQLALCEGLKKGSITSATRVYRVRANADPKQLALKGSLHRGLTRDAMDHLLAILSVPQRRSKKVANGVVGAGVAGGTASAVGYVATTTGILGIGGMGGAGYLAAAAAIFGTGGVILPVTAVATGVGILIGFNRRGKLGRFKVAIKDYLHDQFQARKIRRLYSKQELELIDRTLR